LCFGEVLAEELNKCNEVVLANSCIRWVEMRRFGDIASLNSFEDGVEILEVLAVFVSKLCVSTGC